MISSFFGSFRFGSIEFERGTSWLRSAELVALGRLPLPFKSPRNDQVCTPPVWIEFGLMLLNSLVASIRAAVTARFHDILAVFGELVDVLVRGASVLHLCGRVISEVVVTGNHLPPLDCSGISAVEYRPPQAEVRSRADSWRDPANPASSASSFPA
jgi:hypothetical protein